MIKFMPNLLPLTEPDNEQPGGIKIKTGKLLLTFCGIALLTFAVSAVVTFLYSQIAYDAGRVDWATAFHFAIILGIVLTWNHYRNRKK